MSRAVLYGKFLSWANQAALGLFFSRDALEDKYAVASGRSRREESKFTLGFSSMCDLFCTENTFFSLLDLCC